MAKTVKGTKKKAAKGTKKKTSKIKSEGSPDMKLLERRIAVLENTMGLLSSIYAYRAVLDQLLRLNREWVKADAGTIMILDRKAKMLVFDVVQGKAESKLQTYRMPVGEGIAGWVAETGRSVLVPEVRQDPHYSPKVSRSTHYETRNMICVPIPDGDEVIGVLQLLNHQNKHPFHPSDQQITEIFASMMGKILAPIVAKGLDE